MMELDFDCSFQMMEASQSFWIDNLCTVQIKLRSNESTDGFPIDLCKGVKMCNKY